MKDLSKGSISFKGIMFSSTTTRHGHLPDAPPVVTTTQFALEEHKVDFENNLDMSEEEIQSTNKVVLEMFTSLINASVSIIQAVEAGRVQQRCHTTNEDSLRRQHEKDIMNLADELDAKKHSRIQANRAS